MWGGEFGRAVYSQGRLTREDYGRDHHPRCFTLWLAGGGIRPGLTFGETDDYCYNIVRDECSRANRWIGAGASADTARKGLAFSAGKALAAPLRGSKVSRRAAIQDAAEP